MQTYYLMMLLGLNFSKHLASELAVLCRDSSEYAVFKFNLIHFSSKTFVVGLRILAKYLGNISHFLIMAEFFIDIIFNCFCHTLRNKGL